MSDISPPRIERLHRLLGPASVTAGLAAATVALRLRDPHVQGSWGRCVLAAGGLWCPACGGLRAVHDLTDLQPVAAASSNLLVVLWGPVIVAMLLLWWRGAWRGDPTVRSQRTPLILAGVWLGCVLVFGVVRNLPFGGWLAP